MKMDFKGVLLICTLLVNPSLSNPGFFSTFGNLPVIRNIFGGSSSTEAIQDKILIPLMRRELIYEVSAHVGEDKRPYHLVFGTSYSGIWLFSGKACEEIMKATPKACRKVHLYDDSYIDDGNKGNVFTLEHMSGKITGYVTKETLMIGGKLIEDQDIGIATSWNPAIMSYLDGYFGIQFIVENSKAIGRPFLHHIQEKNLIKELVYGVFINLNRGEGELMLGGDNKELMIKESTAVGISTLDDQSGWFVNTDSVQIGTETLSVSSLKVQVDPANSNIAGRREVIEEINAKIGATPADESKTLYKVDCKTIDSLPTITFTFSGKQYVLKGNEYTWKLLFWASYDCFSYFYVHELKDYDLVLGAPFLSRYYSTYDVDKKTISFAKAIRNPNSKLTWLDS